MKRFLIAVGLAAALFGTSACGLSNQPSMADYAYVPSQASSSYSVVIEPGIDAF